jgi:cysteine desulfurase
MSERTIYFDYAATTPVDPRVAARMAECLTADGAFGNPASTHRYGREARALVEAARAQVAALIVAREQAM